MGCYINPKDQTKEEWLSKNATYKGEPDDNVNILDEVKGPEMFKDVFPVCHVDNYGMFTAAIVCYCKEEFDYVISSNDRGDRPIRWFLCEKEGLLKVSDLEDYLKRG